jgi:hypothetical protein
MTITFTITCPPPFLLFHVVVLVCQVVVWDTRKPSSLPVRRTGLGGGEGHTHPVYALAARPPPLVTSPSSEEEEGDNLLAGGAASASVSAAASSGASSSSSSASSSSSHPSTHGSSSSSSAHGWTLVSASSDGLVCEWDPAALLSPTERLQLAYLPSPAAAAAEAARAKLTLTSANPTGATGAAAGAVEQQHGPLPVSVASLGLLRGMAAPAPPSSTLPLGSSSSSSNDSGDSSSSSSSLFCDAVCVGAESGDLFLAPLDGSYSASLKKVGG